MYMAPAADRVAVAILPRQQLRDYCTFDQDGFINQDTCIVPFWYTKTGVIVKWSIFFGLTAILGIYVLVGHFHAKSRIRKGLKPLAYHRWLVPRSQLALVDPAYAYAAQPVGFQPYRPGYYGMQPMPPPVYDPGAPRPPMYPGEGMPDGATKVDPSQGGNESRILPADARQQSGDYAAPPGPPPAQLRPEGTGSSNPFRL